MKRAAMQAGEGTARPGFWSYLFCGLSFVAHAGCNPHAGQAACETDDCASDDTSDQPPTGVQSCDLHAFAGSPTGICIPHVDAGWHTALVRMVPKSSGMPTCPASAQWPGLKGEEITPPGIEPRLVVGCSVNPMSTCESTSWACVPFEQDYPACVLQTDQDACPDPYPLETRVTPQGGGAPSTVCCRLPEDAP